MKAKFLILSVFLSASSVLAQSSSEMPAADSFDLVGLSPEDQTPLGKFTTAAEVGPILEMTKANWLAVREYDGQDLVYFSHILSWRCGLIAAKFSINGEPLQVLQMPECHMKFQQPNVLIDDEPLLAFRRYELGSVQSVRMDILLDDLTVKSVTIDRSDMLIP
ncbi:hypothetical protein [uncultured Sulfitobacter sp.]|uniref:hypothetical protein n=1 Tax=uncultured Sulfitobacter sp. TaxID=191468 RepID=UPI00262B4B0E|nr:hypothetical protein [uncultured Sulfitobacter sp.]